MRSTRERNGVLSAAGACLTRFGEVALVEHAVQHRHLAVRVRQ